MNSTTRRAGALALLVGVLAGLLVALVVPTTRTTAASPPVGGVGPLSAEPPPALGRVRIAAARPEPSDPGRVLLDRRGVFRFEARTSDPGGGPDWVLRTFLADRVVRDRPGGPTHVIQGSSRCVQLGRLVGGRFGWIDATNTFRPALVGLSSAPTRCGSRLPDARRSPQAELLLTLASTRDGGFAARGSVAWGLAGSAAQAVTLRLGRRRLAQRLGRNGTFLRLGGPDDARAGFRADVRYPTGRVVSLPSEELAGFTEQFRRRFDRPRTGAPAVIAARAPDPNGGLPFGLLAAPGGRGGWCVTSEYRLVGALAGSVDYRLGTLTPAGVRATDCRARLNPASRENPLDVTSSYGGGFAGEDGEDPLSGRVARRTLRGRTTYSGTAHPEVVSITIVTPRGVRTFSPDARTHTFLVVYDGTFPTGETVLTSTFRDGTSAKQVLPASSL